MSTKIESLEVEILSSSTSAVSGITALSDSLNKLKTYTKGGIGLASVSKQITSVGTATKGINTNSVNSLTGLAKAIQLLNGVKVSSTIGKQITEISTSLSTLNIGSGAAKIQELVTALRPLSEMPKQNISSTITQLKKLPTVFAELQKMDMGAFSAKIKELATALQPLANEMQKVSNGFSAFPTKIQKLIASTNSIPRANKYASLSFVDLYAKLQTAMYAVRRFVSGIATCIKETNTYIENVNLFTVSMGQYADEASSYADKVSELMGIDPSEWMRNQGTFMTLATGFGVVSDRAYIMSKNLTQLGYDISSFFNIPYEDAMAKLQSGLAGELEPLRRIGYDLSNARLQQEAYTLGITKKVSAMNQAEKAELRYYTIMTQVTQSHGDMARTLEAPANQLRVLQAQVTQAARAIGSIFIPVLNKILPYAIAVAKVVRYLASAIAGLFGFEMPEVDYSGVEMVGGVAEDTADSLSNASDSAKKLKSYMMGFDELNVIDPTSSASSGSTPTTGGSGLGFDLPEYDFIGDLTESRVATIVEEMKEWLGITGEIDSWSDLFDTKLGGILTTVGLIGGAFAAWKIATGVSDTIKTIKGLGKVGTMTLGLSLVVVGITIGAMAIESALTEGLNGVNATSLLGASASIIVGGMLIGKAFGSMLMGAAVSSIITGVAGLGVGLYDAIKNELNITNGLTITFSSALIGFGIAALVPGISAGMGAVMGAITGAAIAGSVWIVQNTDDTITKIGGIVSGALLAVGAILAFTGVALPLGIGLMVAGAVSMGTAIALNTDKLSDEVKDKIAVITSAVSVALLAVGAVIAFTGANIPLGIALMAGGALTMGTAIIPKWDELSDDVKEKITMITAIVGGALLALGAILAFSGANIPLGIGLMLTGALSLGTAIGLNWDTIQNALRGPVGVVTAIVGGALLALGAILAFTGVGIPIGIALMLTGAAGLATVVALNWDTIKDKISSVVTTIAKILSGAMLVLGVLMCLSGAGIGLGLALIFGSLKLSEKAWGTDDNPIINFVKKMVNGIVNIVNKITAGINDIFHISFNGLYIAGVEIIPAFNKKLVNIPKIPLMADGGFPDTGQMFIAREAGPEMVGTIGRRTAVVNNEQIVSGIASGVAEANSEQNTLLREQNSLLRALLEKESGVYLDGRHITNSVEKYQRERGRTLVTGGVV